MAFLGPNELSVIERCPYYRGVRKKKLDCMQICILSSSHYVMASSRAFFEIIEIEIVSLVMTVIPRGDKKQRLRKIWEQTRCIMEEMQIGK